MSTSALAQEQQIDSLIKARYPDIAPGCVVLVAKKGQVVYRKAFGLADTRTKAPMTLDGVFRLGSMSKQYTATAILKLVEQGRIKLTDSVQVYVKDFPHKAYPVSIANLLSNSSGIINFQEIQRPDPENLNEVYTPKQGVDYFKDEPLQFKPGSQFYYSNSNFYLLGYIIEQVTGKSYGHYIEQEVLAPAGLRHTYYLWPGKTVPGIVPGYSRPDHLHWQDAELQNVTILYATGGLTANITDVWKWHEALMQNKVIHAATRDEAWTASPLTREVPQYGYGWFIKELDGLKTVEHSGSTDGYQTDEIYIPSQDLFVATLFNGFETDMDWQVLSNDIARLASGNGLRKALQLSGDSLQRFTGIYKYNNEHSMLVTLENHHLFIEASNPKDRLPKVELLARSDNSFYIKEAALQFLFVHDPKSGYYQLQTYIDPEKKDIWPKFHN
jgi:CubicO group peptidase (beta-lactamase class C family)